MVQIAKLPLSLIPTSFYLAVGRALQYCAAKYSRHQWRRGMPWSEPYSALQRHLIAWNEGERYDEDSGLSHLDHAAACLAFLIEYEAREAYHVFDDRFKSRARNED